MGLDDFERIATSVRHYAGVRPGELPLSTTIAERVLGLDGVVFGLAGTSPRLDCGRIIIPIDHPDINWACAHELAHYVLERVHFVGTFVETEDAANYLAAAILAPPDVMRRVHAHYGERIHSIAATFALSQTSTVLRLGEVLASPRAVVTSDGRVLTREPLWRSLPTVAIARGEVRARGIRKARLTGPLDIGRTALRHAG